MRGETYKKIMKYVSVVVVMNLAFGGFLSLMLMDENGNAKGDLDLPPPVGDTITINSQVDIDGTILDNNTLDMDYNIIVTAGGILNLNDATLVFQSDTEHRLWLRIENGGQVNLDNSTLTVETSGGPGALFDNYETVYWFNYSNLGGDATLEYKFKRLVPFNVTLTGATSKLTMRDGSSLEYEGELYITGGSQAIINDSVISSPSAQYSKHDWGVVLRVFSGSEVVFADSRIEKSPWYQGVLFHDEDTSPPDVLMYKTHLIKDSSAYFLNTYFDLDYRNKTSPDMYDPPRDNHFPPNVNKEHNALQIQNSEVKFYGLTIDMTETNNKIPDSGSTAIEVLDTISDVSIYRWVAVYPVDSIGVGFSGADVTISTGWTGDPMRALVNGLNDLSNPSNLWEVAYLNRVNDATLVSPGPVIQFTTGTFGRVIVALVSDVLTDTGWPNSDQVDLYNIDATYAAETREAIPNLENYPRLFPYDNLVEIYMDPFSNQAPHPELYPLFIEEPQSSLLLGNSVWINFTIFNMFETPTGVDVTNLIYQVWDGNPTVNGSEIIKDDIIGSILAGANDTVEILWTPEDTGVHTIYVAVDRNFLKDILDNQWPEINEVNNTINTKITVREKADLNITSFDITFNPSNVIVNGESVTINAYIKNTGGSTATGVLVRFYDGPDGISPGGPLIGSKTIDVPAGSGTTASISWGPAVGKHYVWVVVDELDAIPEKDEFNNEAYNTLEVKPRPNLSPSIVFIPDTPQYDGEMITIEAKVANDGGSNVTENVEVIIYMDDPSIPENEMGRGTFYPIMGVTFLVNESRSIYINWEATPPGTYTIWVVVDPNNDTYESDETDNMVSRQFVVNPKPNLVVLPEEIVISDPYVMNASSVKISFTIRNTGKMDIGVTDYFHVQIWLDEIGGSGTKLTVPEINVTGGIPAGGSIPWEFDWLSAVPPGQHDVWVYLDSNDTIDETIELADNKASARIIIFKVPSDLIINDSTYGTLTLQGYQPPHHSPYTRDGFTLVEEHGTLIIKDSVFEVINQRYDDEFNIVVKDEGTLILEWDSELTSEDSHVNIYLYDYATLYVNSSTLSNFIDIYAYDNAEIYINEGSSIEGKLYADDSNSNVYINAVNSSFSNNLQNIGGHTFVELWGVLVSGHPADDGHISVTDSATVYINWFLTVYTVDVNEMPITGADVTWWRSPPWIETGSDQTNAIGAAYFWLRGMNITSEGVVKDIGSYTVEAQFFSAYKGTTFYPNEDPADKPGNTTVWMIDDDDRTIHFKDVKPELDPPLFVDPNPTSVGDPTTITTYVNNTGANAAFDVDVKFFDNKSGEKFFPKIFTNESIPAGGTWMIQFEWIPELQGYHLISVNVDYNDEIIEEDEENNDNSIEVYVGPQKADLNITAEDIMFALDPDNPYGPTEEDTLTIYAYISNDGETDASNVVVEYYKDPIGAANFLGWGNLTKIKAGQTGISELAWSSTSPAGLYKIWVVVVPVDETRVDNNNASNTITIKTKPDLTPTGLDFSPASPVTDTTLVTITADIENVGETDAEDVIVQFFDGDPALGKKIGSDKKIFVEAENSNSASVVWTATVIDGQKFEDHTIYVVVSGVDENFLDNNTGTGTIRVELRPDLTVVGISFSDDSPYVKEKLQIYATINNSGGKDASNFNVAFYDGNPTLGNQIGAPQPLSVPVDEERTAEVDWQPEIGSGGSHEIFVVADVNLQINEFDETNNEESEVIVVYSQHDLIVNGTDTLRISPDEAATEPLVYLHGGYTLVEDNGTLILSYTTFKVLQPSDYVYNIIVKDRGTFIIEDGSVILTNGKLLRIYLYDDAKLYVNDSMISSTVYEILTFSNVEIYISESTISSNLKATPINNMVTLDAVNSSLTSPFIYFGGNSVATFTNVYTPSVEVSDKAIIWVYKLLKAYVVDGSNYGIPGADVTVTYLLNGTEIQDSPKQTDSEGLALFKVLVTEITAGVPTNFLNFRASASYLYKSVTYTGSATVAFEPYTEDTSDNIVEKEIVLSELRSNLFADSSDITFWKGTEGRTTVGVGEEITIKAVVHNNGTAITGNVLVQFYYDQYKDTILGPSEKIGEGRVSDVIEKESGTGTISITWIPQANQVGGDRHIYIVIDPWDEILEINEDDNKAFEVVDIVLPPDLSITNIRFDVEPEVIDTDNATQDQTVTVRVTVRNADGHHSATSINVSVYDGNRDFGGELIDYENLGATELLGGYSTTRILSWDTTDASIGDHFIYAYVMDATYIGGYTISDQNPEDNKATKSFYIHTKPDLKPIILFYPTSIALLNDDGSEITGDPQIGQDLIIQATIYNDGRVYIASVNVSFYLGDPESGGSQIGSDVTIALTPNNYINASIEYSMEGAQGQRTIYVWVNKDQEVLEHDYDNNIANTSFDFIYAPVDVVFTSDPKTTYKVGESIRVEGRVTKTGTTEGISGLEYSITITNTETDQEVFSSPDGLVTNAAGFVPETKVSVPDAPGTYELEITVDYAGTPQRASHIFTVKEKAGDELFLPLWMLLILIVSAIVAVLLVGVALAKYGLGKLVECGECGAFIPEGEKKCPKCGAVFETDTAKCSECGAWIPVDSKSCPECGAVYAGIEKEKKDYIERMKAQYMEYVDQYRDEAKADLGPGMTDEEFMDWWKANPKYVGFEDWLSREEELRKGKTYRCPECGTINPESATICFKCGSVFKKEEEEELPAAAPPRRPPAEVPPKTVPREAAARPPPTERRAAAPPTVAPKKVVRPPEVVPKKVVKAPPTVVPKKVVRRPPPEEEEY